MNVSFRSVLTGVRLKAAKLDKDGMVVEPAKIIVQMETPIDADVIQRLSRMFEADGNCELETPQMEMRLA